MSLRDVCDISLALQVDIARQEAQTVGLMVALAGGEYIDPVRDLYEELAAEPAAAPVDDLRLALGLRT